jgi:hypothetical protein
MLMQVVALVVVIFLARKELVPALAIVAFVILAIRAVIGLLSLDTTVAPRKLGIAEFALGAFTVVTVTVGYSLGW